MSYQAPLDETQLIADLQNPSKASDAFDAMMRRYGEKIYWQIRKMVVNHDDAVDLLQNVFLKAWNSLQNFRGDAKISTWLYKIASQRIYKFHQQREAKSLRSTPRRRRIPARKT